MSVWDDQYYEDDPEDEEEDDSGRIIRTQLFTVYVCIRGYWIVHLLNFRRDPFDSMGLPVWMSLS